MGLESLVLLASLGKIIARPDHGPIKVRLERIDEHAVRGNTPLFDLFAYDARKFLKKLREELVSDSRLNFWLLALARVD